MAVHEPRISLKNSTTSMGLYWFYIQNVDVFMRLATGDPHIGRTSLHGQWSDHIYRSMDDLSGLFLLKFTLNNKIHMQSWKARNRYQLKISIFHNYSGGIERYSFSSIHDWSSITTSMPPTECCFINTLKFDVDGNVLMFWYMFIMSQMWSCPSENAVGKLDGRADIKKSL